MKPCLNLVIQQSHNTHQPPLLRPGNPKSIWTSPNNDAMSPYTWQVLRYSAHVLFHAGTPPSIPIPTHSEQSKPRAQAVKTIMILWVWAQIKRNWGNTLKSVFGCYTDTEPLGDLSWHEMGRSCIETVQDWKNSLTARLTNERDKLHRDRCNDWSEMGKCGFILLRWLKLLLYKVLKVTWYFVLVQSGDVWQLDAVTFSQTVVQKFVHRGRWEHRLH